MNRTARESSDAWEKKEKKENVSRGAQKGERERERERARRRRNEVLLHSNNNNLENNLKDSPARTT